LTHQGSRPQPATRTDTATAANVVLFHAGIRPP
jgi:hypothetical protein